ncbi:hypothetical protein KDK_37190 [Dictyobacter kobayashii]|uniref:Glycosyltransferase RgtA/B/C/D-like domain-containing protein n=2 Tax=Dictyobacter kobayashii TaxID=2014872 RepID=A0A402ALK6_9CHLR|nr:hypothetical protein KDK_37190 [Dictyobacter kobayashii]
MREKTKNFFSRTQISEGDALANEKKASPVVGRSRFTWSSLWRPSVVVGLLYILFFALVTVTFHYHLTHYVHIGTYFSAGIQGAAQPGRLNGAGGYDGQFYYFIARDPFHAASLMDNAPYRYQRIVYPLLALLLSFNQSVLLTPVLLLINFVSIVLSVEIIAQLLTRHQLSPWYSLAIGLYFGQMTALLFDTTEPLTYLLLCVGLLLIDKKHMTWAAIWMGLAVLSRETAALFPIGFMVYYLFHKRWLEVLRFGLISLLPTAIWYALIVVIFGKTGLTYAPTFQLIPFKGLFIFSSDLPRFIPLLILMFIPVIVGWLLFASATYRRQWGGASWFIWFINLALVTCMAPGSYKELVSAGRLSMGIVLAILFYGWQSKNKWVLWGAQIYALTGFIYALGILNILGHYPS